jgi:putative transposase
VKDRIQTFLTPCPNHTTVGARPACRRFGTPPHAKKRSRFDRFVGVYWAKYPKAAEKLTKDRDEPLAFYDFPVEHWQQSQTTNPIKSTFATVRHRTTRTRNCVSRPTFLGLAFKLIESAEQSWRRIRGSEKIASLLEGIPFKHGLPVTDSTPALQPLGA